MMTAEPEVTPLKSKGIAEDDPRLVFVNMHELILIPPKAPYVEVFWDLWWVTHRTKQAVVFWDSRGGRKTYGGQQIKKGELEHAVPQANAQRAAVEMIISRMYPWAVPVLIERAFRPCNPATWAQESR
jgi:hypothetical protein